MKVTLLGTGTSGGVPSLGCNCKVCRSTDPRDRHLRSAVLLETSSTRVLIDCGPDIREQLLPFSFGRIDAVLIVIMIISQAWTTCARFVYSELLTFMLTMQHRNALSALCHTVLVIIFILVCR